MLKAHHVFKTEHFAELGGELQGLVVDGVAPVETDQRRAAVCTRKQLGADQSPKSGIWAVVAHKDRNLELDIHPDAVKHIAHQDSAGINVQHLAHAVICIVVQVLVQPFERVMVWLPHSTEIAGDGGGAVQVDV